VTGAELEEWIGKRSEELSVWLQKIRFAFLAPAFEKWVRDGELPQGIAQTRI
jgi:hypothetical protein